MQASRNSNLEYYCSLVTDLKEQSTISKFLPMCIILIRILFYWNLWDYHYYLGWKLYKIKIFSRVQSKIKLFWLNIMLSILAFIQWIRRMIHCVPKLSEKKVPSNYLSILVWLRVYDEIIQAAMPIKSLVQGRKIAQQ